MSKNVAYIREWLEDEGSPWEPELATALADPDPRIDEAFEGFDYHDTIWIGDELPKHLSELHIPGARSQRSETPGQAPARRSATPTGSDPRAAPADVRPARRSTPRSSAPRAPPPRRGHLHESPVHRRGVGAWLSTGQEPSTAGMISRLDRDRLRHPQRSHPVDDGQAEPCLPDLPLLRSRSHMSDFAKTRDGWTSEMARSWLRVQKARLKAGDIEEIEEYFAWFAKTSGEDLSTERGYWNRHRERLRFADFRSKGLPNGSGAVESAVRRVINLHLKGASICWTEENAEGVLHLRAHANSGRWDELEDAVLSTTGWRPTCRQPAKTRVA